jgi:hypothetical protein
MKDLQTRTLGLGLERTGPPHWAVAGRAAPGTGRRFPECM